MFACKLARLRAPTGLRGGLRRRARSPPRTGRPCSPCCAPLTSTRWPVRAYRMKNLPAEVTTSSELMRCCGREGQEAGETVQEAVTHLAAQPAGRQRLRIVLLGNSPCPAATSSAPALPRRSAGAAHPGVGHGLVVLLHKRAVPHARRPKRVALYVDQVLCSRRGRGGKRGNEGEGGAARSRGC